MSFIAVDLGATSGRVMLGTLAGGRLEIQETARFPNIPLRLPDGLHWDLPALYRGVLGGIAAAYELGKPVSIGVDAWGVDYGLLDSDGRLLGLPYCYRDSRTDGLLERIDRERVYRTTGIQFMQVNTLYQLMAERQAAAAETLLLIPDLIGYLLTGERGGEFTNATTTQLIDIRTGDWARDLARDHGIPDRLLPDLRQPGDMVGELLPHVVMECALGSTLPVRAVASHDTASAVVAVPADGRNFAYISCGTWALVGLETDKPVITAESLVANFTNEGGLDGRNRFLRNVMGLWLLQSWNGPELPGLLAAAADEPGLRAIVDPDHPIFLPPGDIPARIVAYCRATGQRPPDSTPALIRCVLESLALAFAAAVTDAERLSGMPVETIHLVGGGARNQLLCRLTAEACGRPVIAGPVEATVYGNVLVQARAHGGPSTLSELRQIVRASTDLVEHLPAGGNDWSAARSRFADLASSRSSICNVSTVKTRGK